MNPAAMLEDLERRGVKVWAEGERLRYRGPKKALTPDVLAELKAHKAQLLRALRPVSAWDTEKAVERSRAAYRYVAEVYPRGAGYAPLDAHTAAAWEAERVGDWPAFEDGLRNLMRAAKREAMRQREAA